MQIRKRFSLLRTATYEAHIKRTHPRFTDSSSFKDPVSSSKVFRPWKMETNFGFLNLWAMPNK